MILNNKIPNHFLIDFDGTITTEDVAFRVLDKFAGKGWRHFDELLDRGEMSLKECMVSQYGMIKSDKNKILEFIENNYSLRGGFEEFVATCINSSIPVQIVSAGIDFVINHILMIHGINIDLKAIKAQASEDGMKLKFQELKHPDSRDFKEDFIKTIRNKVETNIIYIGDGNTDFFAAENADLVYCVKNSRLENYCIENIINYRSFTSFLEIENDIRNSLGSQ